MWFSQWRLLRYHFFIEDVFLFLTHSDIKWTPQKQLTIRCFIRRPPQDLHQGPIGSRIARYNPFRAIPFLFNHRSQAGAAGALEILLQDLRKIFVWHVARKPAVVRTPKPKQAGNHGKINIPEWWLVLAIGSYFVPSCPSFLPQEQGLQYPCTNG